MKKNLAVVRQSAVPQGKAQSLLLEEVEAKAVTTAKKAPETKKGSQVRSDEHVAQPAKHRMGGLRGQIHACARG